MSSEHNWKDLYDEVFRHSNNTDYDDQDKTLEEWKPAGCTDDGGRCLCGVKIVYLHTIQHVSGKLITPIGSTCIKKFPPWFTIDALAAERVIRNRRYACNKAIRDADEACKEAAETARWAVAVARVTAANAPANEVKRKTSEAKKAAVRVAKEAASWAESFSIDSQGWAIDARDHETRGNWPVPDNFHAHQGKTLAQLWKKHRSYCEFVMEKNRVHDPEVRYWFREQSRMFSLGQGTTRTTF
jgi:hypothetical protein|tara:strand:+ start:3044 stop:3769 length:726 start_codon:yes stop_codon:yes gene_type:complete